MRRSPMARFLRIPALAVVVGSLCLLANPLAAQNEDTKASHATVSPAVNDSAAYSKAACAALMKPGSEDHWVFLRYRLDAEGIHDFQVPFASHEWFSKALQDCVMRGWAPRSWYSSDLPAGFREFRGVP